MGDLDGWSSSSSDSNPGGVSSWAFQLDISVGLFG